MNSFSMHLFMCSCRSVGGRTDWNDLIGAFPSHNIETDLAQAEIRAELKSNMAAIDPQILGIFGARCRRQDG
jgi:hypothetical protein